MFDPLTTKEIVMDKYELFDLGDALVETKGHSVSPIKDGSLSFA
jgi:hypothetical protein